MIERSWGQVHDENIACCLADIACLQYFILALMEHAWSMYNMGGTFNCSQLILFTSLCMVCALMDEKSGYVAVCLCLGRV